MGCGAELSVSQWYFCFGTAFGSLPRQIRQVKLFLLVGIRGPGCSSNLHSNTRQVAGLTMPQASGELLKEQQDRERQFEESVLKPHCL